MAVQFVEKTDDGLRHNLANRHTAGLRMRPKSVHDIRRYFDGDRNRGGRDQDRRIDFRSFLKISVSLSARQSKLLGQCFGGFGQGVTLCQQVECGIQPVSFVGV